MRVALFESLRIGEVLKHLFNTGADGAPCFRRDTIGNDFELLTEHAGVLQPVVFKSGATFQPEWLHPLHTRRGCPTARVGTMLMHTVRGQSARVGCLDGRAAAGLPPPCFSLPKRPGAARHR